MIRAKWTRRRLAWFIFLADFNQLLILRVYCVMTNVRRLYFSSVLLCNHSTREWGNKNARSFRERSGGLCKENIDTRSETCKQASFAFSALDLTSVTEYFKAKMCSPSLCCQFPVFDQFRYSRSAGF